MKHKRFFAVLMALLLLVGATLPAAAAGLDDGVTLKEGQYTKWIDQLDLTGDEMKPLRDFYTALEEGADNDGADDFLIDDHAEGYMYDVVTVSGSFSASTESQAKVLINQAANTAMGKYQPFIMAVYDAFDRDHPEVFWLSGQRNVSCKVSSRHLGTNYSYEVTLSFSVQLLDDPDTTDENEAFDVRSASYPTAASIRNAIVQRDQKINTILLGVGETQSVYKILQYFNEKLTKSNQYNTVVSGHASGTAPADAWECISALVGRTGTSGPVCEGYARALKVLCDKKNIPCVLVDGEAKATAYAAPGAHMWNYVQVDDKWYAIDVTWNDPTGGNSGAVSGNENEAWFLHGSNTVTNGMTFLVSHPVSNTASVGGISFENGPQLNGEKYNYLSTLPPTVLDDVTVANGAGQGTVTYGESLVITVSATAGSTKASGQTMALYLNDTELAKSTEATDGVYRLTYNTRDKKLPAGSAQTLTLRFIGDNENMVSAMTTVTITVAKATPVVAFSADAQSVDHTGSAVQITAPAVTLLGEDTFDSDTLTYSYEKTDDTSVGGDGLPKDVGTYTVTATLSESDWYLAASDTLTLTVVQPSTPDGGATGGGTDQSGGGGASNGEGSGGSHAGGAVSDLLNNGKNAVTEMINYSSLRTVLIAFAALGLACMLIAIVFGREKRG